MHHNLQAYDRQADRKKIMSVLILWKLNFLMNKLNFCKVCNGLEKSIILLGSGRI